MADDLSDNREFLVLPSEGGGYYAIPRDALESYRVPEEYEADLEKVLNDEVTGFSLGLSHYTTEQVARYTHQDRLREAEQMRRADEAMSARHEEEDARRGGGGSGLGESSLRNALTAVFLSLPFLRRRDPGIAEG